MKCQVCNIHFFSSKQAYERHIKSKRHQNVANNSNNENPNMFQCTKCSRYYSSKSVLCNHKKICTTPKKSSDAKLEEMQKALDDMRERYEKDHKLLRAQIGLLMNAHESPNSTNSYNTNSTSSEMDTAITLEQRCKQLEDQLEDQLEKNKTFVTIQQQGRRRLNKYTRQEVANRQENKCNKCASNLSKYYQIDHITGLQFGGTDEFDNLQALCCECHAEKSILENQHRKEIQEAIQTILIKHGQ